MEERRRLWSKVSRGQRKAKKVCRTYRTTSPGRMEKEEEKRLGMSKGGGRGAKKAQKSEGRVSMSGKTFIIGRAAGC